jgi:hypothetical protein
MRVRHTSFGCLNGFDVRSTGQGLGSPVQEGTNLYFYYIEDNGDTEGKPGLVGTKQKLFHDLP